MATDHEKIARALKASDARESILGFTPIQAAFGFCAVAGLGSLLILPLAPTGGQSLPVAQDRIALDGRNIDRTAVGSIQSSSKRRYSVRRSVLNPDPQTPCVIFDNGTYEGSCPTRRKPTN
ncbi:hypothetical protein [Ahrensia sp. R2A130]|uniref:hypothetical protein n=1 Tax=Ahrensia sp. R2A130 TaxID=744979 RepID=UPI0001E0E0E1|nr:hypothetical protein [Ahrensia sp. R2A130]EFL87955.1 hypothetical protein R2A130_1771 [Ahrensia sp. R2A130]